jgi:hypothetical protein
MLEKGMQWLGLSKHYKKGQDGTFFDSAIMNRRMYDYFLGRLMEMCITRFKYNGLPDSIDERFMEYTLMMDGQAIWFNDEVMGNLCLQVMLGSKWDIYRVPMMRKAYAVNGYIKKNLNPENSVIIYNNPLRTNSFPTLEMFAYRLYNIDRAADINVNAQRTPILIRCTENQRLTLKNIYMKYDGNQPVIYGDKDLDLSDKFEVLKTDAPFVANDISEYRVKVWNEALSSLGIASVQNEKQERMLMSEATSGMGSILATRIAALKMREQALHKINKMFGLNVTVEFNEGIDTSVALQQQEAQVEATIAQAEAMANKANMDVGQGD